MSRSAVDRFSDILAAIDRCLEYRPYLDDPKPHISSMAYDAVLRNLAVIGEAARALPESETTLMPLVPWRAIAGLRNVVVHEYFRVNPDLIRDIVDSQLVPLAEALRG